MISRPVKSASSGFSLVEVALALLVMGIGMVAVFGLLPVGMDANKRAIDDAQVSLFADEVLNGLLAKAQYIPWSSVNNMTLTPPAPNVWDASAPLTVKANFGPQTNLYQSAYTNVIDFALRYSLAVGDVANSPHTKFFRLTVWNGQYGSTINPSTFYTELYDTGL